MKNAPLRRMLFRLLVISILSLAIFAVPCKAANFRNLDFSEAITGNIANISSNPTWDAYGLRNQLFRGSASDLFPGWQITYADPQTGAAKPAATYLSLVPIYRYGEWDFLADTAVLMPRRNVPAPAVALLYPGGPKNVTNEAIIGDIRFLVPEPSTALLLGVGGLAWLACRAKSTLRIP